MRLFTGSERTVERRNGVNGSPGRRLALLDHLSWQTQTNIDQTCVPQMSARATGTPLAAPARGSRGLQGPWASSAEAPGAFSWGGGSRAGGLQAPNCHLPGAGTRWAKPEPIGVGSEVRQRVSARGGCSVTQNLCAGSARTGVSSPQRHSITPSVAGPQLLVLTRQKMLGSGVGSNAALAVALSVTYAVF